MAHSTEPKHDRPLGCDSCPLNVNNAEVKVPYGIRVGVAIASGLFLASQCYVIQYGWQDDGDPNTVEVGRVGAWVFKTEKPNYLVAAACAAIAMTSLGIRFDTLIKLIPGRRDD
jgi:hypothetical protein